MKCGVLIVPVELTGLGAGSRHYNSEKGEGEKGLMF
jgi:hypothetical protein